MWWCQAQFKALDWNICQVWPCFPGSVKLLLLHLISAILLKVKAWRTSLNNNNINNTTAHFNPPPWSANHSTSLWYYGSGQKGNKTEFWSLIPANYLARRSYKGFAKLSSSRNETKRCKLNPNTSSPLQAKHTRSALGYSYNLQAKVKLLRKNGGERSCLCKKSLRCCDDDGGALSW